jgi:hypothetical protein
MAQHRNKQPTFTHKPAHNVEYHSKLTLDSAQTAENNNTKPESKGFLEKPTFLIL